MRLQEGARLGPYDIVGFLGTGRMGEVYKARDTRLGRLVAIKILAPEAASDPTRRKRFEREARTISQLLHPHICTLFDTGEEGGVAFLAMEYLPGETLAHRLLRGSLPVGEALQIAVHLADALDAAHRQGVTHRDLKPSNVMLTPAGAKVLDFGLAGAGRPFPNPVDFDEAAPQDVCDATITHPGGIVCTLQYMPPEQFNGRPDARSDLFALGAIIFEMVTGRKAFDADTNSAVVSAIESRETPAMCAIEPFTPPSLDRVVKKCLAKDPWKRWQTAADLRDELDWIARDLSSSHTPVLRQSKPHTHRRQWLLVTTGLSALAVALAVILVLGPFHRDEALPATSFVVLPPDNASDVEQPTISPDGRTLAFVARIKDGKSALWIRPLESLEARPIADADSLAFPFWSPDSHSLAFFNDGQLKRVAVNGGPTQAICVAPAGRGGTWSPSGVIVFASSAETALSQVAASGGAPKPATVLDTSPEERSHRFPQFLSDGRRFLYTAYLNTPNRNPLLRVGSIDTATSTVVTETSFARSLVFNGYMLFHRDRTAPFLAQPFDETTLTLRSEPIAIIDRLMPGSVGGAVAISGSRTGVLTYQTLTADPVEQLTWFGRAGKTVARVGSADSFPFNLESFALSPDGLRAAVLRTDVKTHRNDIWVVDLTRGLKSRVTVNGTSGDPKWSPDGRRIAFISDRLNTGEGDIYIAPSTAPGEEQPLLTSAVNKFLWDWSADGALLLFSAAEGPKAVGNLWTVPADGSGPPRRYFASEFTKADARFSPDTRWVAYQSNEAGPDEVFVRSFPDPEKRYQISNGGGALPRWRRDGKELFYLSPAGELMAVTVVRSNAGLEIDTPKMLFRTANKKDVPAMNFEVAPDGQRFLFAEVVSESPRSPITVVLNWTPAPR
jgi:serine/threonine protein kinase